MSEYVTTITQYLPQQVDRSDGSGSFTLHKFKDINGTELVARNDVANLVRGYLNQPLVVTVRSEQKGKWTNHYLDHAAPAQGNMTQPQLNPPAYVQQAQQAQPQPIPPPTPPPPLPPQQQQQLPHEMDAEKNRAIHRQTAAKVAAELSTTPDEFWRNVLDLSYYFDTGNIPQRDQGGQPSQDVRPPYTDDDIPF